MFYSSLFYIIRNISTYNLVIICNIECSYTLYYCYLYVQVGSAQSNLDLRKYKKYLFNRIKHKYI